MSTYLLMAMDSQPTPICQNNGVMKMERRFVLFAFFAEKTVDYQPLMRISMMLLLAVTNPWTHSRIFFYLKRLNANVA